MRDHPNRSEIGTLREGAVLMSRRVLVVDDDPVICKLVTRLLGIGGYLVETVETGGQAIAALRRGFHGVIVLDVRLPDTDGPTLFGRVRELAPGCPVVFLTSYGSADLALETITDGAFEFIDKQVLLDRLSVTVASAFSTMNDETPTGLTSASANAFDTLITESAEMTSLFRSLRKAVGSKVPVLITGESGTGKELIARAIHKSSPQAHGPFMAINCAGIPEPLLEAELFGYERGAFTGAVARKIGKFEAARGGTLLLDEIGEMHPLLQAKLLRVLQEGEFQRLGSTQTLRADVRVLSATNRNLDLEIEEGRFRADLYYRLAVYPVHIPPLRERRGDVDVLVAFFTDRFASREGRTIDSVDDNAMSLLREYDYPGNVRELENILSYAVVSARGKVITIADLPPAFLRAAARHRKRRVTASPDAPGEAQTARWTAADFPTLATLERRHIAQALELTKGNKTAASNMLGISRMTLYRKLADLHEGAEAEV